MFRLVEHELKRIGDIYREIKVGATFLAERGMERSELVKGVYIDIPKEGSTRSVARRTESRRFWSTPLCASRKLQGSVVRSQVVVLGDGAVWCGALVAEHFPDAVQIVDLYPALEHVWEVAHAAYGRKGQKAEIWAKQACTLLVNGKIEELVKEISKLPKIPLAEGESRSVSDRAVDYFTTNAKRMRYPTFRGASACISALAFQKLHVKPWLILVPSNLACVGLPMVWTRSCPYVRPFSTAPTTSSGWISRA